MFRRIVLDNFLSFDHLEFDLVGKRDEPLTHALIYGENGSGKTNLMSSVVFLRESLDTLRPVGTPEAGSLRLPEGVEIAEGAAEGLMEAVAALARAAADGASAGLPRLSSRYMMVGSEGPMRLSYEFQTAGGKGGYSMEFDLSGNLVREELRCPTGSGRTGRCYLVESSADGPVASFGRGAFGGELSRVLRQEIRKIWGKHSVLAILKREYVRSNESFMREGVSPHATEALWFLDSLSINAGGMSRVFVIDGMRFDIERGTIDPARARALDAFGHAMSSFFVRLYSDIKEVRYEHARRDDGMTDYRLVAVKEIAGARRTIPFERESAGTRKLLHLFPALLACGSGGVSFIDELDSGVHDKMVRDMMAMAIPELRGQLVLTTHNTLLLETADPANVFILRVDGKGYKEIRPVSTILKTQRNHNNRDRYLQGLFDGIPYVRELDIPGIADRLDEELRSVR